MSYALLRTANSAPPRRNSQFVVFETHLDRISHANPHRLANLGGNHDPAFLANLNPRLDFHASPISRP